MVCIFAIAFMFERIERQNLLADASSVAICAEVCTLATPLASLAMSLEKCVVITIMTFGLCVLGAYTFIGLPWLVLTACTLFCCRVVQECFRLKYPPQQCLKDYAVESAILPW